MRRYFEAETGVRASRSPARRAHFRALRVDPALENALSLVAPGGRFSVVLQLPASEESAVAKTPYPSMQRLVPHFAFIDPAEFRRVMEEKGFVFIREDRRQVRGGKSLWMGIFVLSK